MRRHAKLAPVHLDRRLGDRCPLHRLLASRLFSAPFSLGPVESRGYARSALVACGVRDMADCARGPGRLPAAGWLLLGATPVVWMGTYLTLAVIDVQTKASRPLDAPLRIAAVWASWILDVEARYRYASWTRGRHALLIDDGRSPHPEKLVAEMDDHIEAMARLLGQPVRDREFPWVRGSLFGLTGHAILDWAICRPESNDYLTGMDRHEVAHTLITALAGPDQYPPALFTEGWAESQSQDRAAMIRSLARAREEGWAYPLQELVRPAAYELTDPRPWAYWEGGPLVQYLIDRYGPKTFFRLYAGVRPGSFRDDCRAILGDSWETVEEGFWKWIAAEDKRLAKTASKGPAAAVHHVKLAKSVNPADWKTVVDHCRQAYEIHTPLPANAALVCKSELSDKGARRPVEPKHSEWSCSAVFEGRQFWICGNCFQGSLDGESYLMSTADRDAHVVIDPSGLVRFYPFPRDEVVRMASSFQRDGSGAFWLPFRENEAVEEACRIERVIRPAAGTSGRWSVWVTRRFNNDRAGDALQDRARPRVPLAGDEDRRRKAGKTPI